MDGPITALQTLDLDCLVYRCIGLLKVYRLGGGTDSAIR